MSGHVKVGGAWKTAAGLYVKVGGVWKTVSTAHTKVGGVWKQWFSASNPAMELIGTQILGATNTTITFSSIPQTYKHLQLRVSAQVATSGQLYSNIRFNSSSSGYNYHNLQGSGAGAGAGGWTADTQINTRGGIVGYDDGSTMFTPQIIDILDYTNTSKNTTVKLLGCDTYLNYLEILGGSWDNTSAVNSIQYFVYSNGFSAGSRFSLYGIKG